MKASLEGSIGTITFTLVLSTTEATDVSLFQFLSTFDYDAHGGEETVIRAALIDYTRDIISTI